MILRTYNSHTSESFRDDRRVAIFKGIAFYKFDNGLKKLILLFS